MVKIKGIITFQNQFLQIMPEVSFLFDNQLIAAVEKLIRNSKNRLILISPYIDFDARIQDALSEKMGLHNFELLVLFGKNENNYLKSIKKNSLEFLKQFPNIEIRYSERLHAKFYQNDFEYIITSLNLYDYSLANNIEVGVRFEYALTGLVGKALNVTGDLVSKGIDKVNYDVLGNNKDINPIEKFKMIFDSAELKFKSQPIIVDKSGIQGLVGFKKLGGNQVIVDNLETNLIAITQPIVENASTAPKEFKSSTDSKKLSASQLAKILGVSSKDITNLMQIKGYISDEKITPKGISSGLIVKSYMGNDYIAYPDNLDEWSELNLKREK